MRRRDFLPLERSARPGAAAWEKLTKREEAEKEEHDKAVSTYSLEMTEAVARDIWARGVLRGDLEGQWLKARRSAIVRRLNLLRGAAA